MASEVWKEAFALIGALVVLFLGWSAVAGRWEDVKKRRQLELEVLARFYEVYGEFFGLWKVWEAFFKTSDPPGQQFERTDETRWKLFSQAAAAESGFEAILVRIVHTRHLDGDQIDLLSRFRQGYQHLRERIRDDKPLDWHASEQYGQRWKEYQAFKYLSVFTASLLSDIDHGYTRNRRWMRFIRNPKVPTLKVAASNMFAATSVRHREDWYDLPATSEYAREVSTS